MKNVKLVYIAAAAYQLTHYSLAATTPIKMDFQIRAKNATASTA